MRIYEALHVAAHYGTMTDDLRAGALQALAAELDAARTENDRQADAIVDLRAELDAARARATALERVAEAADKVYGGAGWIGVPAGYRSVPHDRIVALGESLRSLDAVSAAETTSGGEA
jgi:hypothetical protein